MYGVLVLLLLSDPFMIIELDFEEKEVGIQDLYYVASSFDDFLHMIKYDPGEDDLDGYEVEEVWINPNFLKELRDNE